MKKCTLLGDSQQSGEKRSALVDLGDMIDYYMPPKFSLLVQLADYQYAILFINDVWCPA
ncbi:hypothetical protein [uncultured Photobacterium sp.]|uniref:hypothetical protein n=1 Tax=uncultured Photobacterium sp. TaxID=173973 RepID=UPI0026087515|nr:hypothetical protein [uncultured Photobacterium sp.]